MGMVASTLPVQWLLPTYGWRPLFWGLAAATALAMVCIAWVVPAWQTAPPANRSPQQPAGSASEMGYKDVFKHPYFQRHLPLGLFVYGGLVAMQTLWSVPWMIKVAGYSPSEAATGLFWLNVCMLLAFWSWGMWGPKLAQHGITADTLIVKGLPLSFALLLLIVTSPAWQPASGVPVWALWAAYCVSCTFVASAQPAVALAFPAALAGRALSAYNLLIFLGVFMVQWGVGLLIDGFKSLGWTEIPAHQGAMAVYGVFGLLAYGHFTMGKAKATVA
jgi:hypothetical protein